MGNSTAKYGIPAAALAIIVCLSLVCCSIGGLYFFGDAIFGTGSPSPFSNPAESIVPADISNLPEWTVLVYADADDDILEQDIWFDINEMELVGSTDQLNIVVQLDRAEGAFSGDGDWSHTRRYYITQDDNINAINSYLVEEIGEADMGNPQTLVDFMRWGIQNYPAKKYALILSDHGGGWTGGWSDLDSGSALSMGQITNSIASVQAVMGGQKFEIIGFDACLMGMVEVYGSLYPYSNYMVASEEVIPATGWSYAAWLNQVANNPTMSGREVSQAIVSTYIVEDAFLNLRGSSSEIREIEAESTLSAIESARMPEVISAMNQFTDALANLNQEWVAQGRGYTLSYYSLFGEDVPSPFIDLGNFSEVMATTEDPAVVTSAANLQAAISAAVIAEKHGNRMAGSTGMSLHFPISDIYTLTELTNQTRVRYARDAAAFLEKSSWDEFLAYHYTGLAYEPSEGQAYVPQVSASMVLAPGAAPDLAIAPVQVSSTQLNGDQQLTLSTTVTGSNISYIYFVLYFYNEETNAYWIGDTSYVFAEETTTINGVSAPNYGPSPVQVQYTWDPSLFVLKDGQTEAFALFEPDEYINADGVSTYSVYGQYTAINAAPVDAKLTFDPDGNLLSIFALPDLDNDGISTPVEITPQIGDQFTDYVQSYVFDAQGNTSYTYSLSNDVFVYGDQGFWFEARYPVAGQYAIGFIAYDFDNNSTSAFEFITYKP